MKVNAIRILSLLLFFALCYPLPACDIELVNGICIGKTIITKEANPISQVAHYDFDTIGCVDMSGNGFHAKECEIQVAPGIAGLGNSAKFMSNESISILTPDVKMTDFSYTFWIFLMSTKCGDSDTWVPLIQRGGEVCAKDEPKGNCPFIHYPSLFLSSHTNKLQLRLTTDGLQYPQGEQLVSNAQLPNRRWHHISIVKSKEYIKLYVNGILDNAKMYTGKPITSPDYEITVGVKNVKKHPCPNKFLMDELRIYGRKISVPEIEAEASSLLEVEAGYIQLGCFQCGLSEAQDSCVSGYHLCRTWEMYSGVYTTLRGSGWVRDEHKLWTFGDIPNALAKDLKKKPSDKVLGTAVCCRDLDI